MDRMRSRQLDLAIFRLKSSRYMFHIFVLVVPLTDEDFRGRGAASTQTLSQNLDTPRRCLQGAVSVIYYPRATRQPSYFQDRPNRILLRIILLCGSDRRRRAPSSGSGLLKTSRSM